MLGMVQPLEVSMANGFQCGMCGWEERIHKDLADFLEEDRPLLVQVKKGFTCSLEDCEGYYVTEEEARAEEAVFLRGGAHEGQH